MNQKITKNKMKNINPVKFFIIFVVFTMIFAFLIGGFVIGNYEKNKKQQTKKVIKTISNTDTQTYNFPTFSINIPKDYQINENKIVATQGIEEKQENTVQIISPTLPNSSGNMSIIIAYKPLKETLEKDIQGTSTCPQLQGKKLTPIKLGDNIFSTSGLIGCGPNQAAFFYSINNNNVYEAKVESTANYEKNTLPQVLQILSTLQFSDKINK